MKLRAILLITLFTLLATDRTPLIAAGNSAPTIVFTAAPTYLPLAWTHAGDRFPKGAAIYIKDSKGIRKLFPDFAATADPNVSFDATHLLFAGKKKNTDPWQIWEAAFEDLTPRLVVNSKTDSIRPLYLPEDRFAYAALHDGRLTIENASLESAGPKTIYFGAENAMPSDVLRDGRILLTSVHTTEAGKSPEIFALYSDGSGFESIRCDHAPTRFAGRELASGDIVFTHGATLSRFTSPSAAEVALQFPRADYAGDIAELANGDWIISTRETTNGKFTLKTWHQKSRSLTPLASLAGLSLVQPVVVAKRTTPNRHPSALHDWKYANLLALNVYTSKHRLVPGSVASVNVFTRDANGSAKLLGSSAVEKDGSFFVRVPGDQPLQFELADAHGKTLQRERGWFWSRGGEQRVCVGCHAGPERAPENAVPAVLNRSTEPVDLTGDASQVGGH